MEDSPDPVQGDADPRASPLAEFSTERSEQVLDIRPDHVGPDWILEDGCKCPTVLRRQWHSAMV